MWNDKHTVTRVCSYVFSRYLVTTCFRASSEECLNKSEVLHHGDDWKEYEILRWHPFGFFHLTALKRWKESVHVRKTTCTQRNGDFLGCLASITSRIYPRLSTYIVQYNWECDEKISTSTTVHETIHVFSHWTFSKRFGFHFAVSSHFEATLQTTCTRSDWNQRNWSQSQIRSFRKRSARADSAWFRWFWSFRSTALI